MRIIAYLFTYGWSGRQVTGLEATMPTSQQLHFIRLSLEAMSKLWYVVFRGNMIMTDIVDRPTRNGEAGVGELPTSRPIHCTRSWKK